MERRTQRLELFATRSDKENRLSGYAAKYGVRSHVIANQFREYINPGAFDYVLGTKPDVVALINHDANKILGRTTSGTLRLSSDRVGLMFEIDMPNTSYANDLYAQVQRGDMNGCSFAFAGVDDYVVQHDNDDEDGDSQYPLRVINRFKQLHDISVVTQPAYPETEVDARELELVGAEMRSRVVEEALNKDAEYQRSLQRFREIRKEVRESTDRIVVARRREIINSLLL